MAKVSILVKIKSMKEIKERPYRGIYTKVGRTIITEFQKNNHKHAEVNIEYNKPRELLSLYNAIKSLIRRKKLNLKVSIDQKEGKLFLMKV